jgi:hypothetical protein
MQKIVKPHYLLMPIVRFFRATPGVIGSSQARRAGIVRNGHVFLGEPAIHNLHEVR